MENLILVLVLHKVIVMYFYIGNLNSKNQFLTQKP